MTELSELQVALATALRHDRALEKEPALAAFAMAHIAGSDRLSPVEQLEIYREQFWLRHTSSLVEDFPGLGGILGQADWEALVEAYLRATTPDSYTLRDLGSRLVDFVAGANWLPHQALCLDMARLELAYIEVFDAPDSPPLAPERLATIPEDRLGDARLVVAPAVRLLALDHPVHDLRRQLRAESNEPVPIPGKSPVKLAVYRHELRLWDMTLSDVAFRLLSAFEAGIPLGPAAESAVARERDEGELAEQLGNWLQQWTRKGLIADVVLA